MTEPHLLRGLLIDYVPQFDHSACSDSSELVWQIPGTGETAAAAEHEDLPITDLYGRVGGDVDVVAGYCTGSVLALAVGVQLARPVVVVDPTLPTPADLEIELQKIAAAWDLNLTDPGYQKLHDLVLNHGAPLRPSQLTAALRRAVLARPAGVIASMFGGDELDEETIGELIWSQSCWLYYTATAVDLTASGSPRPDVLAVLVTDDWPIPRCIPGQTIYHVRGISHSDALGSADFHEVCHALAVTGSNDGYADHELW